MVIGWSAISVGWWVAGGKRWAANSGRKDEVASSMMYEDKDGDGAVIG